MFPLYVLLAIYFLLWWLFLYFWKKGYRAEMLTMSVVGMLYGPFVEMMHLKDWWHPQFAYSNFPIRIEDIVFGFAIAGVSAVVYQALLAKKERRQKSLVPSRKYQTFTLAVGPVMLIGLFYFLSVHSFWASVICLVATSALVLIKRRDLIGSMLVSALLVTVMAVPFYVFALEINPYWFQQEWFLEKLSGINIWLIPIEELAWYFFVGLTFSAIWEFANGLKFVPKKIKK